MTETLVKPGELTNQEPASLTASGFNGINLPRVAADWWDTPKGQQAEIYLRAWGLTTRGRRDTGDCSYVPQMDFVAQGSGSNRSHPSNMPDVLLRFIDVDRVIKKVPHGPQRLARWAFADCVTTRHSHRAIFRDGTYGEWIQGPQPGEMPTLVIDYEEDTRQVWEWDFDHYPALEGEERYWKDWSITPARFLSRSLVDVGRFVAKELGL